MGSLMTLLVAILGGGFSGFLPFWITRMDSKKNKNADVLAAIDKVWGKIEEMEQKIDERYTISCRIRILRFYDEMRSGIRHTKDSWDQCLSDITTYELYCHDHPSFKNNQTAATVNYIKDEYHDRLVKNDFV